MIDTIKKIEDLSLNAWPSYKMELYDGWILRFSHFYTHRTNSVEQFGVSELPWREKIPYCEHLYSSQDSPTIFKISPIVTQDFDYMLENRGYEIQHRTNVMTMELDSFSVRHTLLDTGSRPVPPITMSSDIPSEWINGLFSLKNMTDPVHKRIVPAMYNAILKDTICLSIRIDGEIIATGLGIMDREYLGIYAIHVREDYRHRGYARAICTALIIEGMRKGAEKVYLQVVDGNDGARSLYESLGMRQFYSYWFRVKDCR